MRRFALIAVPLGTLALAAPAPAAEHDSNFAAARCVLALYTPRPGMAEQVESVIARHVPLLQQLSYATPRLPLRFLSSSGTYVELFEWQSLSAFERAETDPGVDQLWQEFSQAAVYARLIDLPESGATGANFSRFGGAPGVIVALEPYKSHLYKVTATEQLLRQRAQLLLDKGFAQPGPTSLLGSYRDRVLLSVTVWNSEQSRLQAAQDGELTLLQAQLAQVADEMTMGALPEAAETFPHFLCL